jgi:hypothetical protein
MNPYLFLGIAPRAYTRVPSLTRSEGVRALLENPPTTRYDGWNLVTLDRAQLVRGERLSVSNGTRKHIDLFGDGTFLAFAGFRSFLGWRADLRSFDEVPKINALALVEFVCNFVLVYDDLREYFEPRPETVRLAIGLRHAHFGVHSVLYLLPGPIHAFDYRSDDLEQERFRAPEPHWRDHVDATLREDGRMDIGASAYMLVARLYHWFGLTDEQIPYREAEREAIDLQQIQNPPPSN